MQNVLKRAWVKNVAIIFLTALLVLTFFSNTIMNRSLPEVATQGVSSGPITARVRGTGKVTAVGAYELKIDQTRKVQSVLVRAGQEVSAGDVLFVLGEGASEELEQAAETLRQLELSYKRAAAGMPVYDTAQINREIQAAKEDLAIAEAAYNKAKDELQRQLPSSSAAGAIVDYDEQLRLAEKELSDAKSKLEEIKTSVAEEQSKDWTTVQEHQMMLRVLAAKEEELRASLGIVDPGSTQETPTIPVTVTTEDKTETTTVEQQPDGSTVTHTTTVTETTSETVERPVTPANNSDPAPTNNDPAPTNNDPAPTNNDPAPANNDPAPANNDPAPANNDPAPANNDPTPDNNQNGESGNQQTGEIGYRAGTVGTTAFFHQVSPLVSFFNLSRVGMSEQEKALADKLERDLENTLAGIATDEGKLAKVQELQAKTQTELQAAQTRLSRESDPRIEQANAAVAAAQAKVDALLKGLGAVAETYIKARDAKAAAEKALSALEQTKASNGRSAASASIELQDLSEQIARAKQKLEELAGGTDNQITAPVSGIIESIGYTAGNTAPKGEILCTIQVPDMGYTLAFSVTNEQARRLRTGDSATVSNYYWGSEVLATLATIQTDPQAPQTNKLLTFDVTGDVNPGSELTISVGSRSQNYDIIVPNSAIRSDTNGSFVLRLEARNSPLGNRYFARRVEVTVLGQDDVNSAVSGDLSWGDFIITTSDRPVNVGDQVRMSDNG